MGKDRAISSDVPGSKRDRILDEALQLAGLCGYRGFSFKDLADRCGLTKQGVLHYFPSKEDLLIRLLNERDASIESDLVNLLSVGGFESVAVERKRLSILREALAAVIEHLTLTPEIIRLHVVLRAEAMSDEHPARGYFSRRDKGTLEWLADRLAPLTPHPNSTARLLLATMIGLQSQWLQENRSFDLSAEWRRALDTLLPDPKEQSV